MTVRAKQQRAQRRTTARLTQRPASRWSMVKRLGVVGAGVFFSFVTAVAKEEDERAFFGTGPR